MTAPNVTIKNVTSTKISDETGKDISEVTFSFDQPTIEWTVNVLGTAHGTGTVAEYDSRTVDEMIKYSVDEMLSFTVDESKQFDSNVDLIAEIDHTELYQEGDNRVNIYGKNQSNEWSSYKQLDDVDFTYSLYFNGEDSQVIVNNSDRDMQPTQQTTWEALFKIGDSPDAYDNLMGFSGNNWDMRMDNTSMFRCHWQASSGMAYADVRPNFDMQDGNWHRVSVVWDGIKGTMVCYLDGIECTSLGYGFSEGMSPIDQGESSFAIGSSNGGRYFNGYIKDVRIWEVVRSSSDINKTLFKELTGTENGLNHYYKMNEGTGNNIINSVQSNNGLSSNTKWVFEGDNPSDVHGLEVWYDANTLSLSDGESISQWDDLSGNGNHLTQSSSTERPIFTSNILNGKPVVRFDGTNDYLLMNTRLTTIRTAIFVVNWSGAYNPYTPLIGDGTNYEWVSDGSTEKLFSPTYSHSYIQNGQVYVDGINTPPLDAVRPSSHSIITVETVGNLTGDRITKDRNISGRVWRGDYAEVIIYNRVLTDSERSDVENYLKNKWGIS